MPEGAPSTVVEAEAAPPPKMTMNAPAVVGSIAAGSNRVVPVPVAETAATSSGVVGSTPRNTSTRRDWPSAMFPVEGIVIDVSGVDVMNLYETCNEVSYVVDVTFSCVPIVDQPEIAQVGLRA